ncbi:MAG: tRNA (adenosine(37)-N6)-threonylcarbamoyltransferase complex dimerization subunit type 1 TsaB [Fimbriimonadaceae bacterium]|nr:tRNA (adenosine(37)-N6)-threonylcarbamoyltransferase complex dimerization subunit type 1 TsaB [Fimbriimonadaceae bacterium]
MILSISTSSPYVSVAYLDKGGQVLAAVGAEAKRQASAAILRLLEEVEREFGLSAKTADAFIADIGPGSFTGVKVGVTMAKTFGYAFGKKVGGVSSFDLVSASQTVVIPNVAGKFFVREPGKAGALQQGLPKGSFVGYGVGVLEPWHPDAAHAGEVLKSVEWVAPEQLVALYIAEPSISAPKRAYGSLVAEGQSGGTH